MFHYGLRTFIALDFDLKIHKLAITRLQKKTNFMKLEINFEQTRATSAGHINSPNALV